MTDRRLRLLEDRIDRLEAIVDGGDAQVREATAYVLGLVTRYLHEAGLIDGVALRRYVGAFAENGSDADNHVDGLVRHLVSMLEYHERHPSDFTLPGVPRASAT